MVKSYKIKTKKLLLRIAFFLIATAIVFLVGFKKYDLKKPNILIILTDDQGFHDVSFNGTKDVKTPNIDEIAHNGMILENFYANSPVCSPTRAALLSGKYPDQVGVPGVIRTYPEDNWGYLDPKAELLPEALKKAGYSTAIIGKWHLGLSSPNLPNEKGFDYFHGWLGDMMDDYLTHRRHGINYMRKNEEIVDPSGHATDLFTQWSVDYIANQSKRETPFFLYLAFNAPHAPVQPPKELVEKVKQRNPNINPKRAELVALIEHLDDGIGKVLKALKDNGLYENTLIVFTSDNGGNLPDFANNGPNRDGKQSMYEGGLKVPTCVSWPGKIKAGSNSSQVNLTMDLFPTLLEAGQAIPSLNEDSKSFLSVLLGKKQQEYPNRTFYFTRREGGLDYNGQCSYAIRQGDWKLLRNKPGMPMELYNLKNDPLEKENVINQNITLYKELNKKLMLNIQKGAEIPWQKLK